MVCQRWCVTRWCVTKWCVKDGVSKMVCDKMVCQRWCVTKLCVKDGVCQRWWMTKCHACHAKRRWMSKCHACHAKSGHRRPIQRHQARHQSQPSAISATPATQNEGRCLQVPRLPRKRRWMSPSATPATQSAAASPATKRAQARHQSQPSLP